MFITVQLLEVLPAIDWIIDSREVKDTLVVTWLCPAFSSKSPANKHQRLKACCVKHALLSPEPWRSTPLLHRVKDQNIPGWSCVKPAWMLMLTVMCPSAAGRRGNWRWRGREWPGTASRPPSTHKGRHEWWRLVAMPHLHIVWAFYLRIFA